MENTSMVSNARSAASDHSEPDDYVKGNFPAAKAYKERQMVRQLDKEGRLIPYPLGTPMEKLGKLGIGIEMYFRFLKFFSVLFFFMSLASIPGMYNNFQGSGLEDVTTQGYLQKLMVANQPKISFSYPDDTTYSLWSVNYVTTYTQANEAIKNEYVRNQKINWWYCAGSDILSCLIFLIGIQIFTMIEHRAIQDNKEKNISLVDYSIKVTNFPPSVTNEQDIAEHFSQFGEIVEAGLARNYQGTLNNFRMESIINKKMIIESKRLECNPKRKPFRLALLEKTKKKVHQKTLSKMNGELKGLTHDEYPSLWAYVVFNNMADRNKVFKAYKDFDRWTLKRIFCNCLWSLKKVQPINYQLNGEYPLRVEEPDVPSNILWQNQEVTNWQRFKKKVLSYFLTFIVFAITLTLVLVASNITKAKASCPTDYTKLKGFSFASADTQQKICYCSQSGKNYFNVVAGQDCYSQAKDAFYTQLLNTGCSFVIVITNAILQALMIFLSNFERYKTVTDQTYKSIIRLTTVLFINTGVLSMLLNSNISGFNFSSYVIKLYPSIATYFNDNSASARADFDRLWYPTIGDKVSFTLVIMIFTPHITQSALGPCINCIKACFARCKFLQVDMNAAIMPPSFDLTKKYSHILNALFVIMLYSPGMPHLNVVAFFIFLSSYWFQKYILLRVASRPIKYSAVISQNITKKLKISLVIKLLMCLWVYTAPDIWPVDDTLTFSASNMKNEQGVETGTLLLEWLHSENTAYGRRLNKHIYLTLSIAGMIALAISESYMKIIMSFLGKVFYYVLCCFLCCKNNKVAAMDEKAATYGEYHSEYERLRTGGAVTYKIRENNKYRDLVYALDFQEADASQMSMKKSSVRKSRNSSEPQTPARHSSPPIVEDNSP